MLDITGSHEPKGKADQHVIQSSFHVWDKIANFGIRAFTAKTPATKCYIRYELNWGPLGFQSDASRLTFWT